jgi:hypothetical protein
MGTGTTELHLSCTAVDTHDHHDHHHHHHAVRELGPVARSGLNITIQKSL